MNDIYYRIYYNSNKKTISVVCMQSFDEEHYDQSNFITEEKYKTEEEATLKLAWFALIFSTSTVKV